LQIFFHGPGNSDIGARRPGIGPAFLHWILYVNPFRSWNGSLLEVSFGPSLRPASLDPVRLGLLPGSRGFPRGQMGHVLLTLLLRPVGRSVPARYSWSARGPAAAPNHRLRCGTLGPQLTRRPLSGQPPSGPLPANCRRPAVILRPIALPGQPLELLLQILLLDPQLGKFRLQRGDFLGQLALCLPAVSLRADRHGHIVTGMVDITGRPFPSLRHGQHADEHQDGDSCYNGTS
jgi:hypothetical protein